MVDRHGVSIADDNTHEVGMGGIEQDVGFNASYGARYNEPNGFPAVHPRVARKLALWRRRRVEPVLWQCLDEHVETNFVWDIHRRVEHVWWNARGRSVHHDLEQGQRECR